MGTTQLSMKRRLWMTWAFHVMCWRMERSRSIQRTLGWSQGHRRKVGIFPLDDGGNLVGVGFLSVSSLDQRSSPGLQMQVGALTLFRC